jgi:hypothetical protein
MLRCHGAVALNHGISISDRRRNLSVEPNRSLHVASKARLLKDAPNTRGFLPYGSWVMNESNETGSEVGHYCNLRTFPSGLGRTFSDRWT